MNRTKVDRTPKLIQSLCDQLNQKYLRYLNSFDRLIFSNLHEAGIQTRSGGSNGLWCCAILPAVLIIYSIFCKVSPVYRIVTYTSLGLFFYSFLILLFLSVSCLVLQDQIYGGCIASSFVSALLLYVLQGKDLIPSILFTMPAIFSYNTLLRYSLTKYPNTFTIGEAMIVSQSIVLYIVMTISRLFGNKADNDMEFVTNIVNTMLTTVGVIVTALILKKPEQRNMRYLTEVLTSASVFGIIMLHCITGPTCIVKIWYYVFMDFRRLQLFAFWLFIVMVAISVLLVRTKMAEKANTVTRKSFHILASLVFMSGIIWDQELMTLAAGFGLALLILAETLRKTGIEPIAPALQSAFLVYSDEKDSGTFAMTPFYLYCGLACPLLLVPKHSGDQLELLSGVLSIGIGDTAASWFGSKYGFNKWVGSNKSVEGTTFNILSQMSTIYALQVFGLINAKHALLRTAVAAIVSGLTEAMTVQVDNLVIPLVTILAFQITWPLS